jgi:ectoine hydroxylase-related dioxygenase (phytanoyl-CoA dioxygenase family)
LKPVGTVESNNPKDIDSKLSDGNLSIETQLQYSRNGHGVLRSVLSQQTLMTMRSDLIDYTFEKELEAWRQKVEVATKSKNIAKSCMSVKDCKNKLREAFPNQELQIPFLQYFNTWLDIPSVKSFVTSPRLSKMAQALLDVPKVRLYQDSLFHKRTNDGPTPWHSDARMAPFDTSHMITFWIPLQGIPKPEQGGSGLWFVDKSHSDFALPFWNPQLNDEDDDIVNGEYERLDLRYGGERSVKHHMPMSVGDCTVHSGWTLHSANAGMNSEDRDESDVTGEGHDRYALAVIYVDARAEVREDVNTKSNNRRGHDEDKRSFQNWVKDVNSREYFEHPSVPIVWPPQYKSD